MKTVRNVEKSKAPEVVKEYLVNKMVNFETSQLAFFMEESSGLMEISLLLESIRKKLFTNFQFSFDPNLEYTSFCHELEETMLFISYSPRDKAFYMEHMSNDDELHENFVFSTIEEVRENLLKFLTDYYVK